MSIGRCLSRVVAVGAALIVVAVGWSPRAEASGNGAGVADATVTYAGEYPAEVVKTYQVLRLQGRIKVAGQAYGGGFEIRGMTAISDHDYGGQCPGLCVPEPTQETTFVGRDAGAVHGIGSNLDAVNGQCKVVTDSLTGTGPLYLVDVEREITIDCVARVRGSAPTPFTITVTGHDDYVGHILGAFTVS